MAGTVEVILVCLFSGGIPFLILHFLYGISAWAGLALETLWECSDCHNSTDADILPEDFPRCVYSPSLVC